MRHVWTMTLADLRQRLRDKSVIIFSLVVPIALISVLHLVMPSEEGVELSPVTVAASVPDGDASAAAILDVLTELDGVDVTVEEMPDAEARAAVEDGTAGLALIVPHGFQDSLQTGEMLDLTAVVGDEDRLESEILLSVVRGTLDRLDAATVTAFAAAGAGVAPEQIGAIATEVSSAEATVRLTEGTTASEQLSTSGALVAGQAGLFLLFTVGFGVLGLVTEREQGTLARLRSMPMPTWTIGGAKALTSFVLGIVATSVLLAVGSLLFDVDFGDPLLVGVLVVSVTLAATAIMLVVARLTRTSEQAGIAQTVTAMLLGVAGGAFFPMSADGLLGRLIDLNPVGSFTRALGITAGGGGAADILVPVTTMLGFAVVVGAVSRLVPDRGTAL